MKLATIALIVTLTHLADAQFSSRTIPRPQTPASAPGIPVDDLSPDFPLRVHIVATRFGGAGIFYHGYGAGNILEDLASRGFDYTFECSVPFTQNEISTDFYKARWKQEPYRLELLMGRPGSSKQDTCNLEIALRPAPFESGDVALASHGTSLRIIRRYDAPDVAFAEPDPDYPVRLHVISTDREHFSPALDGYGTANLLPSGSPTETRAVAFTYHCGHGFLPNSTWTGFYSGHWVEPDRRLEILLQRTGSDKVDRCQLKVTINAQPYIQRQSKSATTISPKTP